MASKPTIKGELVLSYIKKFPDMNNLGLAKKIYKENPLMFNSAHEARQRICYYKGSNGKKNRKHLENTNRPTKAPLSHDTNPYRLMPSHAEDYTPFVISQSNILIISDLHFPYQHNEAITLALNYGKEKNVNCILINGDLIDFATISRHEKDWRARSVAEEFEYVREFLKGLRESFPNVRIIFKEGNHDERWEKWLYLKAPEIFDDPEFKLEARLRLGELKIEYVRDKRPIKIGKLTVLHGHELAGGSGGVNPARATFLKTLNSVIVGHYHKTSEHTETTMNGDVISVASQGCLCGMNPLYSPINKWNLGFSHVKHNIKTGEYLLHNKKIIKGKIY